MFERFTDRARRVVVLSQEEARALKHDYIGIEHLLLGLMAEKEGVAAKSLHECGFNIAMLRERVKNISPVGEEPPGGHIPFTNEVKTTLERSLREALQLGHSYIGTEHLLLAMCRLPDPAFLELIKNIEPQEIRKAVIQNLSGYRPIPDKNTWVETAGKDLRIQTLEAEKAELQFKLESLREKVADLLRAIANDD